MKARFLVVTVVLGLLSIPAPVQATPSFCAADTLLNYASAGFSCTIGDKTFGGFTFALSSIGGTPASAALITVVPGGTSLNPAFSFQASYLVSGLATSESLTVGYTATAPQNSPFVAADLSLTSAAATGLAVITAAEALCLDGSFTSVNLPLVCSSGNSLNLGLSSNITNGNLGSTVTFNFNQVTTLGVVKQITLTGALASSASASALNNGLDAISTPEPASLALVLGGSGLLWTFRHLHRRHLDRLADHRARR